MVKFARMIMLGMVAGMVAGAAPEAVAQDHKESNYDEAKVPQFVLPEVLETFKGRKVRSVGKWEKVRRPELLDAFAGLVYGRLEPVEVRLEGSGEARKGEDVRLEGSGEARKGEDVRLEGSGEARKGEDVILMRSEVVEESGEALKGRATRKQVEMTFSRGGEVRKALMLIYLPNGLSEPAPVFAMLNFNGNQAVWADPDIIPSQYSDHDNLIRVAGSPVDEIISRGYGFATVHYFDFFPDREDGYPESVLPLLFGDPAGSTDSDPTALEASSSRTSRIQHPAGSTDSDPTALEASSSRTSRIQHPVGSTDSDPTALEAGQAIAAWAWGCSRMLDYLQTDPQVDGSRVILTGHSRLGKTTLWAGAQDRRFAMIILNEAGCGGAALSKRCFGERVNRITTQYPHWFCRNFHDKFAWREDELPIDQHEALALIAPRPLYVASAEEDRWSDPRGEYLSAVYASQVYKLYGYEGLSDITVDGPSPVDASILNRIGYHIRPGRHDMLPLDWTHYLDFADRWLLPAPDGKRPEDVH